MGAAMTAQERRLRRLKRSERLTMRFKIAMLPLLGVTACLNVTDAAFCGPDYTGAIDRLATALPDPNTPDAVGRAGTAVVLGHDAGCAK